MASNSLVADTASRRSHSSQKRKWSRPLDRKDHTNANDQDDNNEDAPLLQNDAPSLSTDDEDPDFEPRVSRWAKKDETLIQRGWDWVLGNFMNILLLCLLVAAFLTLLIEIAVYHWKTSSSTEITCLSSSCVIAASALLRNLSPDVEGLDPCQDFETYVCEGWDLKHELRHDQSEISTIGLMVENTRLTLRHILESPSGDIASSLDEPSEIDEENLTKVQHAYEACLNESQIASVGSGPLLEILRNIDALFPAQRPHGSHTSFPKMMPTKQKGFSYTGENELTNVLAYLMSIEVDTMVSFSVEVDDKDLSSSSLHLKPPRKPGLPNKSDYQNAPLVQDYGNIIGEVLEALLLEAAPNSTILPGLKEIRIENRGLKTRSDALVQSIIEYEAKIASAMPDEEIAPEVTKYYNPRSIDETRALLPQVSIQYLLSKLSPGFKPEKIIVHSPSYLQNVSHILKSTKKEALQAYLVWKAVQTYGPLIKDEAVKPLQRFNNKLQGMGPEASPERWETCVNYVDRGLGWILGRFYIEKAFPIETEQFGDSIALNIKDEYLSRLGTAAWMSRKARKVAAEKARNIERNIGYPTTEPHIRNPSDLQDYYRDIEISKSTFFANTISITQARVRRMWRKLGHPYNESPWAIMVTFTNGYYDAPNKVVIPVGVMQPPMFHAPDVPQYLTYGAFGPLVGHGISHAFDNRGRHHDSKGNYTDWWDTTTARAFEQKAQCFVDQYQAFGVPDDDGNMVHVNGQLTLAENIADAGGLNAAFAAWKKHEMKHPSQLLPGLQNFSKEQLFFISYGNRWCGKMRADELINRVQSSPDAPDFARLLGTVANSRGFRESFNCPRKEPTCEMW